jgi:hypothetical protein
MTKRTPALILSIAALAFVACERPEPIVDQTSVERILSTLSADEMMGREAFTPSADMAADFIAAEFSSIGLDHFGDLDAYQQTFPVYSVTAESSRVVVNGREIPAERLALSVSAPSLSWTEEDDVNVVVVGTDDNPMDALMASRRGNANTLVLFNSRHERMFARVRQYMSGTSRTLDLETATSTVYVLSDAAEVSSLQVDVSATVNQLPLTNVVGVIPGKRSDEYVLFGAHHDHLGFRPAVDGDSIANGANDDASGVAAVIEFARYFKARRRPERTLVFVAFAAEEKGLIGSGYFSQQLPAEQVVTLFNIEMIGKVGPYGDNAAWITGFDRSDFGEILQSAVEGTGFSFNPEATERTMFFSSDNAPFARLGIPAHSISTTDVEDGDYHQVSDEIETLDLGLMTSTIQAIARAAIPIVSGEATPTRIDVESFN